MAVYEDECFICRQVKCDCCAVCERAVRCGRAWEVDAHEDCHGWTHCTGCCGPCPTCGEEGDED